VIKVSVCDQHAEVYCLMMGARIVK